jgi:hypothetical protein
MMVFVGCQPGSNVVAHVVAGENQADRARGLIYHAVASINHGYPQIGWLRDERGSVAPAAPATPTAEA